MFPDDEEDVSVPSTLLSSFSDWAELDIWWVDFSDLEYSSIPSIIIETSSLAYTQFTNDPLRAVQLLLCKCKWYFRFIQTALQRKRCEAFSACTLQRLVFEKCSAQRLTLATFQMMSSLSAIYSIMYYENLAEVCRKTLRARSSEKKSGRVEIVVGWDVT